MKQQQNFMKEKIQLKIINRATNTVPQLETGIYNSNNETAQQIAGKLSYDYIKILIRRGILVKNESESNEECEVYDLIY